MNRNVTTKIKNTEKPPTTKVKPTRAQLLRFALTGTTWDLRTPCPHSSAVDQHLATEFENEKLDHKARLFAKASARNDENLRERMEGIGTLSGLQVFIETQIGTDDGAIHLMENCSSLQKALLRCEESSQYKAILATITTVVARLEEFDTTHLRILGMYYACLCFSPQALKHHLQEYRNAGNLELSPLVAYSLYETLNVSLERAKWEDPELETAPMLEVLTGVNVLDGTQKENNITLHSSLHWELGEGPDQFIPRYVALLGRLGDIRTLAEIWSKIRRWLQPENTVRLSNSLSSCLLAFIDAGSPEKAIQAVREVPSNCNPGGILNASVCEKLLEHDHDGLIAGIVSQERLQQLLESELQNIEKRLGVRWTAGEDGTHMNPQNLATISTEIQDGDPTSNDSEISRLESTRRLIAETKALGSSKSKADLSQIADLLNNHEGREIPLGSTEDGQGGAQEFAWFPHCSPIEFSNSPTPAGTDRSTPWTPSSLGLIRGRPDCDGIPRKGGRSLYLMQLGYLSTREKSTQPHLQNGYNPWRDTGHIVTWDRMNGKFLVLFIGNGRGIVHSGFLQPSFPPSLPRFSAILAMDDEPSGFDSNFTDLLGPTTKSQPFWIDVDPGLDLSP